MTTKQTAAAGATAPALHGWQRYAPHKQRQPRWIIDHEGNELAHLPCKAGAIAVLDADDFRSLMARGVTTQWHLHGDGHGLFYVRAKMGGKLVMISRLILDAPRGKVIRLLDHNPLNLRRNNLAFDDVLPKQRETVRKAFALDAVVDDGDEGHIF